VSLRLAGRPSRAACSVDRSQAERERARAALPGLAAWLLCRAWLLGCFAGLGCFAWAIPQPSRVGLWLSHRSCRPQLAAAAIAGGDRQPIPHPAPGSSAAALASWAAFPQPTARPTPQPTARPTPQPTPKFAAPANPSLQLAPHPSPGAPHGRRGRRERDESVTARPTAHLHPHPSPQPLTPPFAGPKLGCDLQPTPPQTKRADPSLPARRPA
jgi:hypothetical protein